MPAWTPDNALAGFLEAEIQRTVPADTRVAVLFSGGVDSVSVALAAAYAGHSVDCYTFAIEGQASEDLRAARTIAGKAGWELTVHLLPVDLDALAADIHTLARDYGCVKKTQFECIWPFLHLAPVITEEHVLSGFGADGYFGVSLHAFRSYVRQSQANFDRFRTTYYADPPGCRQLESVLRAAGKVPVLPYLDQAVHDFLWQHTWGELNRPYQKMPTLLAYPQEFRRWQARRDHANLQLVAGVDVVMARLLDHPVNTRGRTRMLDLYRDILARYEGSQTSVQPGLQVPVT